MRIGLTGAAGFIGSRLAESLVQRGHEVVAIDNFDGTLYSSEEKRKRAEDLEANFGVRVKHLDITRDNLDSLVSDIKVLVNQAAIPGLAPSWMHAQSYFDVNSVAVSRLLASISGKNVYFVQASTSSVYGRFATGDEMSPTLPVSPYGASKLAAENLIQGYSQEFGTKFAILRYFSVFGPGQRPDMAYARFCKALLRGDEITVFGDGTQTRTNTYIDDLVRATTSAVELQPLNETMNICGTESVSVLEAIGILSKALGVEPRVNYRPLVWGDQSATAGDATRAERLLNWNAKVGIVEGLHKQAESAKLEHAR